MAYRVTYEGFESHMEFKTREEFVQWFKKQLTKHDKISGLKIVKFK